MRRGDEREEGLYRRLVPAGLIRLMGVTRLRDMKPGGSVEKRMTIMFCDIRDYTGHTERMSPRDSIGFVNSFMGAMEPPIRTAGGVIDKYIGDAVMAVFPGAPDDGLRSALAMTEALRRLNLTRGTGDRRPIRAGIGMNTGMALVGAVGGLRRMEPTVVSDAVNLASRLEDLTKEYGVPIIISENTYYGLKDHLRRGIRFLDRIKVKGKSQPQSIYEVYEGDAPETAAAKGRQKARFEEAAAHYHLGLFGRARELFSECLQGSPDDPAARFYLGRCALAERTGKGGGTGELDGTLEWRDEFAVGVPRIDAQHRELLASMNRVAPLIKAGDSSALEDQLRFLGGYVEFHFGYEEKLMDACAYPFADAHKSEHRRFIEYFQRLSREAGSSPEERLFLIFKVQIFLSDWFACHSTGLDRHLAVFLKDPARARRLPAARV